jgi:tRNA threonylcarbamoyladenosine modification (KEOPS) complex  Pcc1 subunit
MRRSGKAIEADLTIPFSSSSSLEAIRRAMIVDDKNPPNTKALVKVRVRGRTLVLHVQADDIPSLRAALNSNLRLVLAWRRIVSAINKPS